MEPMAKKKGKQDSTNWRKIEDFHGGFLVNLMAHGNSQVRGKKGKKERKGARAYLALQ